MAFCKLTSNFEKLSLADPPAAMYSLINDLASVIKLGFVKENLVGFRTTCPSTSL